MLQDARSVPQAGSDEREPVFMGPGATEGCDELCLRGQPIRLGIDKGAIHVPEDGGGEEFGHGTQV